MKKLIIGTLLSFSTFFTLASNNQEITKDTDSLYHTLIVSVNEADFKLMASTYHKDAVLVSSKKTTPILHALKRWEKDGEKLKSEGGKATLAFRFSKRLINDSTSFEKGIYRYSTIDKSGNEKVYFAHFEDLNVKKSNQWFTIMENQTAKATEEEFNSLPVWQ